MRSPVFLGATVLVGTLLLILFGISSFSAIEPPKPPAPQEQNLTPLERPTFSFVNPVRGPLDAKLTIYEFADYSCAACADVQTALDQALKDFPGTIRVVWKDLPNATLHAEAPKAAQAARCGQHQGAFWEFHDLLMANQDQLGAVTYDAIAAQLKLDAAEFKNCMDQETTRPIIERDVEEGIRLGVDATPFLFVGSRKISGTVTAEQLHGIVEQEIKAPAKNP